MSFSDYWKKAKLPDVGNMQRCELLRLVARQAFNAGRTEMRREIREQEYERKYGQLRSN
jgi:hypothetical protein